MGLCLTLLGVASYGMQVRVDADGLTRAWWLGLIIYRDAWDSLQHWCVTKDAEGYEYVVFAFVGVRTFGAALLTTASGS